MKTRSLLFWGPLLFLWLSGCTSVIKQPRTEIADVRFKSINFESLDLAFDVKISNPNDFGVPFAGLDYDFRISDNSFLSGNQETPQKIEALGESIVEIPLTLRFVDVYNAIKALATQENIPYNLVVGTSFELPVIGKTRVPVKKAGELPKLQMPKIQLSALEMGDLSWTEAKMVIQLQMDNPNAFSLALSQFNYNFTVNGVKWAQGISERASDVSEKATGTISIPITLNFLNIGSAIYKLLKGDPSLNYQFSGALNIDTSFPGLNGINLPVNLSGTTKVTK